jgi:hypothetical protein
MLNIHDNLRNNVHTLALGAPVLSWTWQLRISTSPFTNGNMKIVRLENYVTYVMDVYVGGNSFWVPTKT